MRTVLVVDGQTATLAACRNLLEEAGHRVLVAHDAAEALDVLGRHTVHVVLTELVLAGPHGDALIRAIRARDADVAIVVQTARDAAHPAREMVRRLGIQGWHDKADGPERLLSWIESALQTHDRVARLRAAERAKSQLLASVSHEFRTPLNVILGYLELVREGTFGSCAPEVLEVLAKVSGNAGYLLELVQEFLDTARLEHAHHAAEEVVAVDALVAQLIEPYDVLLRHRPIVLRTRVAPGLPGVVADGARLRVILQNLLGNAAKFTREGSIEIAAEHAGPTTVAIHVTDTGPGFAADDCERVFEPFRQLGTAPAAGSGIGLGLALARRFARLMGGDLTAAATPGQGARFTLVLPAAESDAPAPCCDRGEAAAAQMP